MAAGKKTGNVYRRENYTYGSAARQLEAVPERIERPERKQRVSSRTLANRRRVGKMNIQYVAFLVLATMATLAICVGYLKLRSEVERRADKISRMEIALKDSKAENEATYNRIMKSVNLETIRQIATEELHMGYANEGQVVFYDAEESDYVRQYEDIPEEENSGVGDYLKK